MVRKAPFDLVFPHSEILPGPFGHALTVDVEEWYHTCLEPDYVEVSRRPRLPRELDRLLPELLEMLWAARVRATFFVLGEVAQQVPGRVQEMVMAGHEVGSHGFHHLRAGDLEPGRFRREAADSKALLEDLAGQEVAGFRAPEWSLRTMGNPRLRLLAEVGYRYDSSLAPWPGAGCRANPRSVTRLSWPGGEVLVEVPPMAWGGRLALPGSGWPARLASPERIARAAAHSHQRGGLPMIVTHPWEISGTATPGELTGLARAIHEVGRHGYRERFRRLLAAHPWRPLREALEDRNRGAEHTREEPGLPPSRAPRLGTFG